MATRTFCDGCDQPIDRTTTEFLAVSLKYRHPLAGGESTLDFHTWTCLATWTARRVEMREQLSMSNRDAMRCA